MFYYGVFDIVYTFSYGILLFSKTNNINMKFSQQFNKMYFKMFKILFHIFAKKQESNPNYDSPKNFDSPQEWLYH